jgi:hypothetical protein
MLFGFTLSKPYSDCLGLTITPLSNLKFHLLPLSKETIVHLLKLVTVEEQVFALRRPNEAKSPVCN